MIEIGGYTFKTNLVQTALTHSSYSKQNYERLEFLGDSILDFLVAEILYKSKNYQEAELTRARASIVSEDSLSLVFDALNLQSKVKLGKSCHSVTKAIKCDIIESVIACIYLESGLNECKQFILNNLNMNASEQKDYKSLFQEYAQKNRLNYEYQLDKTEGPAHNLTFYISLVVNNNVVASASAKSKSEAEKKCASIALKQI